MVEATHKKNFKPIVLRDLFMITFGKPIPFETFDKRFSPAERDFIYLKK